MSSSGSTISGDRSDRTAGLVAALRGKEAGAAETFSELYREPLVRFCWGYLGRMEEAEDAVQEIALKVLDTGESIPDHFRPWVYRVARNHCLNIRRARARRPDGAHLSAASQVFQALTGNLTRLARDEMKDQMIEMVRTLPESVQEVLRLRYAEDLSRAEIAEVLEVPESLVKTRLFDGLKKLRELARDIG